MAFIGSNVFKYLSDYTLKNTENNIDAVKNETSGKSLVMKGYHRKLTEIEAVRIKAVVSFALIYITYFTVFCNLPYSLQPSNG